MWEKANVAPPSASCRPSLRSDWSGLGSVTVRYTGANTGWFRSTGPVLMYDLAMVVVVVPSDACMFSSIDLSVSGEVSVNLTTPNGRPPCSELLTVYIVASAASWVAPTTVSPGSAVPISMVKVRSAAATDESPKFESAAKSRTATLPCPTLVTVGKTIGSVMSDMRATLMVLVYVLESGSVTVYVPSSILGSVDELGITTLPSSAVTV